MIYYISSLAITPIFASRAFIPLFITSLLAGASRYQWVGDSVVFIRELFPAFLGSMDAVALFSSMPDWYSGPIALTIFGCLALLEVITGKMGGIQVFIAGIGVPLKVITGGFFCYHLAEGDIVNTVELLVSGSELDKIIQRNPATLARYAWAIMVNGLVFICSNLRNALYGFLYVIDEDDDLRIRKFLSWAEDGLGVIGIVFIVILPVLALVVSALVVISLFLLKKYVEVREAKQRVACSSCQTPIYLCGLQCYNCGEPVKEVRQVGFLGVIKDKEIVTDKEEHRFTMTSWKRCYSCGERLQERTIDQQCPVCLAQPFANDEDVAIYLRRIDSQLLKTVLICGAFSFIPVFGLIPGIIYYRITLIANLRGYIPHSSGCMTKWGVKFINLILILIQPIPGIGGATLPLMCVTNYNVYKRTFKRQARKAFAGMQSS